MCCYYNKASEDMSSHFINAIKDEQRSYKSQQDPNLSIYEVQYIKQEPSY